METQKKTYKDCGGGLGGRCVYCWVITDPCLSLPWMARAAEVPHFTFFKIHTNMHWHTHLHILTWYPWPPTPISRPPLYPACWSLHPSLHPILSKQMRSWLRLKLPVLPVYPVHHLFSSCSPAHLCNICVWLCEGICICHGSNWPAVTK